MPRKSKEELLEKDILDSKKTNSTKPSTVKAKATKKTSEETSVAKKAATSKAKTASSKSSSAKTKTTGAKSSSAKAKTASSKSSSAKTKTASSKSATASAKKAVSKTTATKSKTSKKAPKSKTTVAKSKAPKAATKSKAKKVVKRKLGNKAQKLLSKTFTKIAKSEELPFVLEYYDLPYKYNKTVIKALAQNPNTLFVYWEISDEDVQNIKDKFGEDIFYTTKPVLIIHNLTDKYSFEIDINDFANNWYIHVNDTKCQYVIELGRRPKEGEVNHFPDNYLYVTSSNMIESPNDHVLFYDSEQFRQVRFKNIHTNKYTTRVIKPFLKNMYELYRSLHLDKENVSFDFKNPSSQNPTSNVY